MDIAVIGTGNVGRTLAAGLAGAGHTVTLASRTPDRPDLTDWGAGASVGLGPIGPAAAGAEAVVLATAWDGVPEAVAAAGAGGALDGKVLIDVTNPLRFTDRLELAVGHTDSGGETVQRLAPGARVVKAFNTVGWELMVSPAVAGGPPTMFVAGDDPEARGVAAGLAAALGWGVHDCGDLRAARLLEPMALVWIEHALRTGSRGHAFRLLGT
ncbi:MAG: NAD(P)-binding domain-containing protein, partial [Acidimicrobiia bacterium]|nr:NAD(P)-binding domain-containing protein [Acidimicrobiia bacterium]